MPKYVEGPIMDISSDRLNINQEMFKVTGGEDELYRNLISAGFNHDTSAKTAVYYAQNRTDDYSDRQLEYAARSVGNSLYNTKPVPLPHPWDQRLAITLRNRNLSALYKSLPSLPQVSPDLAKIFVAYNVSEPKVVILGQDPYPTPGVADGMAFSTTGRRTGTHKNIVKELEAEYKVIATYSDTSLQSWADQGVMLLNSVLTVGDKPRSHYKLGWQTLTRRTLEYCFEYFNSVFLAFGEDAQKELRHIKNRGAIVLETSHPSMRSAKRGFLGSGIFRLANRELVKQGKEPINWLSIIGSDREQ